MDLKNMSRFERRKYYHDKYSVMPKPVNKDNQETYNNGSGNLGSLQSSIRVPSLKRSNKVWRQFYKLFPWLKGKEKCNGGKLKKINE